MPHNLAMTSARPSSAPLGPGARLGKFMIVRELGHGGMCQVYEALHTELQKRVAIKTLLPRYASHPTIVERFLREGRAASRIRHRHAIDMIDVGTEDGVVYLAMEYLDGEDLSRRIKREGALSVQVALDLLIPAMAAVVEAHDVGVVHRDLKPANLFLARSRRGQIESKVLDFGISKVADDDAPNATASEAVLGTPTFIAPELIRGARHTSPASDQYSLGVILYQCVTGKLPFRGENSFATYEKVVKGEYTPPRALAPTLPPGVEAVIVRAMALDPLQRYASVTEMGAALLPWASAGVRETWASTFCVTTEPAAVEIELVTTPDPVASVAFEGGSEEVTLRNDPRPLARTWRGALALVSALVVVVVVVAVVGVRSRARPVEAARGPAVITRNAGAAPRLETPPSPPVQQQVRTLTPPAAPAAAADEAPRRAPTKAAPVPRGESPRAVENRPIPAPRRDPARDSLAVPPRDPNGAPILEP